MVAENDDGVETNDDGTEPQDAEADPPEWRRKLRPDTTRWDGRITEIGPGYQRKAEEIEAEGERK